MDSASPTASASTNRGGRPKEWTEPRTRRLVRLYVYTTLPFHNILKLLEEDEFKPGKDAANKIKSSVLGNDPRWLRPKDDDEEGARIRGLRNSLRGRRNRQETASQDRNTTAAAEHGKASGSFLDDGSLGGTTFAHSYRSPAEEPRYPDSAPFAYPGPTHNETFPTIPHRSPSSRFTSFIDRLNTSRQDTGLTTSTDISITSVLREKLSSLSLKKAKRAVKVLKRYTFPKNPDAQRASDVPSSLFQGLEPQSPADCTGDPFNATRAVPGDFLNAELFTHQQQCAARSQAHAAGVCWCQIADELSQTQGTWNTISSPNFTTRDIFGNTMFHYLAAQEGVQDQLLHHVCQTLRDPRFPLRASNTAGQTLLHVLHRSWFQEGSRLDELLETLRSADFDIFATDVYGRSFFHLLRLYRPNSARFPHGQSDIHRMNRRDAFGMKPMDPRFSTNANSSASHSQATQRPCAVAPAAPGWPITRINTQTGAGRDKLSVHTDLLRVVISGVGVDTFSSPNPHAEDSQGRNAFHCLAEVDLCLSAGTPQQGPRGHVRDDLRAGSPGHNKRRHNEYEEIEMPRTAPDSRRLEYLRGLVVARVDANHYDKQGNTPLMSFVMNSSDATKYEKEESEMVIRALVKEARAKVESRNRDGETALHLAARCGKTVALRVLLELGASPHTRNAQGLGILDVIDNLYTTTERDDKNNARFEASRAILTRTTHCAVQSPTLIDEWGMK